MSYFYIMQEDSTGIFKVGVSDTPLLRRISLSVPTNPMILLWAWKMTRTQALEIEREVVRGFASKRAKAREYFHFDESDVLIIHAMIDPHLAQAFKQACERGLWFDSDNMLRHIESTGFAWRDCRQTPERRKTRTVQVNPDNPTEIIRVVHPYSKNLKGMYQKQAR